MNKVSLKSSSLYWYLYLISIPCCLLYYVLVSNEILPPLFAGYYPYAFLLSLIVIVLYKFLNFAAQAHAGIEVTMIDFTVGIFVVFAILKLSFEYSLYTDGNAWESLIALMYFYVVYVLFRAFKFANEMRRRVVLIALVVFLLGCVPIYQLGSIAYFSTADSLFFSYQFVGVFYILSTLPVIVYTKSSRLRFVIYIISYLFLFFNGARTEFVFFIISSFLIEFMMATRSSMFVLLTITVFIVLLIIFPIFSDTSTLQANRVLDLVLNWGQTTSGLAREEMESAGVKFLIDNFWFGGTFSYESGAYIHNILSVWVDLGIFGFLLYLTVLGAAAFSLIRASILKIEKTPILILTIAIFYPSVLFILVSKSYTYLLLSCSLGLISQHSQPLRRVASAR